MGNWDTIGLTVVPGLSIFSKPNTQIIPSVGPLQGKCPLTLEMGELIFWWFLLISLNYWYKNTATQACKTSEVVASQSKAKED